MSNYPVEMRVAVISDIHGNLPALDTVRLELGGVGRVLFCHGSPRNDLDILTALTPEDRVRELIAGADADLIVSGHTHMQFERSVDGVRLINPGSVGMPYKEPGAFW